MLISVGCDGEGLWLWFDCDCLRLNDARTNTDMSGSDEIRSDEMKEMDD